MSSQPTPLIQSIPVELIDVVNPRVRNRKVFLEMVESIAAVGLKRPITVTPRLGDPGVRYDLICGQGRLEAFRELGQATIPALVVSAGTEECLVMGLVENVARRQHNALDLLHDIDGMKKRGHSDAEIARKTGLSGEYVRGVLRLLGSNETRLLRAVEAGHLPVSVAIAIADAEDDDVQQVLQEAYERNLLRGNSLLAARRLVQQRRVQGKRVKTPEGSKQKVLTVNALLRTYQADVDKKRVITRNAASTRNRLAFVVEALRTLLADEGFATLLRAEGLLTLPKPLKDHLGTRAEGA
ncbi:plasmid partitioning protein RepB C-terminal domain-containing protein [Pararoseomonas indoligenes]|uniref:ParB N-terminal domain-containing protein n=1 Tax=Roseomonas indoligenes TaxID=2820811 RepID=A0A940S6Y1_9PROT|nr:plasmid partitioning protein RepB C-terminal domain-containing protein [Pararoseomonas indoligenes]MBP0496031.1 ParB N-terminal domain-containing protein [Pararoseomonas indoligenes]